MSTFRLKFQSPQSLNETQQVKDLEKPQWTHSDKSDLQINVEDWVVHKVDKKGSCKLSDCQVNESTYTIIFKGEQNESGFKAIDYPFVVSMLGQIVPKEDLIHYLKQVEGEFKAEIHKENVFHNKDESPGDEKLDESKNANKE